MGDDIQQQLASCRRSARSVHILPEEREVSKPSHLAGGARGNNWYQSLRILPEEREERARLTTKVDALTEQLALREADHSRDTGERSDQSGANRSSQRVHARRVEASVGASIVPKVAKLDFPKYRGVEDPLAWLSRCDHFFCHQQTLEEERVGLASYHLEGNAQLWFLQLEVDHPTLTWDDFKQQCHLRFGPPIRSNKLGELSKLKQFGSVAAYQEQFEQLVARAGVLTQSQKIAIYISGLQEYISVEVELHNPHDLATAMSLSRLYECKSPSLGSFDRIEPKPPDPLPQNLPNLYLVGNCLGLNWKKDD